MKRVTVIVIENEVLVLFIKSKMENEMGHQIMEW